MKWDTAKKVRSEQRTIDGSIRHFATIEVECDVAGEDACAALRELAKPMPKRRAKVKAE